MKEKSKAIIMPCDCKCCMFVIEKTMWEDGEESFHKLLQDMTDLAATNFNMEEAS